MWGRYVTCSVKNPLFVETFSDNLKHFNVCEFSNLSLNGAVKISFFQKDRFKIYKRVPREVQMPQYHFVLILNPDVSWYELGSINSFEQNCLICPVEMHVSRWRHLSSQPIYVLVWACDDIVGLMWDQSSHLDLLQGLESSRPHGCIRISFRDISTISQTEIHL